MMITISYINFWRDPHNDRYFTKFIESNIGTTQEVEPTKNPDILIASCMGHVDRVRNVNAKCKMFFYGENLNRYPPYNNEELLYDTFDLIVGFKKTNVLKKQIRFPLWLIYYPYYKYDQNDNVLTYIETKYCENTTKNKNHFASIIARHDRGGQRTLICNELSKYGKIESPGSFRKNTNSIGSTHHDKIEFIANGTYNICPENSHFEGYFTEKIFQAFEGGTIPLYWAICLPEPEIINENKYCFCDVTNKESLEMAIHNVCTNPNEYIEGDLFTKDAGQKINEFYVTLSESLKTCLRDDRVVPSTV